MGNVFAKNTEDNISIAYKKIYNCNVEKSTLSFMKQDADFDKFCELLNI